jgi:hypothetical protein
MGGGSGTVTKKVGASGTVASGTRARSVGGGKAWAHRHWVTQLGARGRGLSNVWAPQ